MKACTLFYVHYCEICNAKTKGTTAAYSNTRWKIYGDNQFLQLKLRYLTPINILGIIPYSELTKMANKKQSSQDLASIAAKTLTDPNSSKIQRSLAASVLAQSGTDKITGSQMEAKAAKALQSEHSAELTKTLAGSVLAQSEKDR